MTPATLTQARLQELLHYDPESGQFTWRVDKGRAVQGSIAGTPHNAGYTTLKLDGVKYLRHRCVWLYVYGKWPDRELDHINGCRSDDRLANLRDCSAAENRQNATARASKFDGHLRGTAFTKGRWRAQIRLDRRCIFLGNFDTPEEAHHAYLAAKAKYHTFQPVPRDA